MFLGTINNGIMGEVRELTGKDGNVWRKQATILFTGGIVKAVVDNVKSLPSEGKRVKAEGNFIANYKGDMELHLTKCEEDK